MLDKYPGFTLWVLIAILIGGGAYLYQRYAPNDNDNVVIEKPNHIDISQIDDLKAFVLTDSDYDQALKRAAELRETFLAEKYDEVESFLESIRAEPTSWDLSSLTRFYLKRLKEFPGTVDLETDLAHAKKWILQSPESDFAYTFRAHIYHIKGWDARGSKRAHETPEENFTKMEEYLRFAIADYYQALAINQKNDYACASLIALSKASSDLGLDYHDLLESAEKHLPNSYYVKQRYIDRSKPKWGGSLEYMFYFARSQDTKEHPQLAMLLAYAHEYRADQYARKKILNILDDTEEVSPKNTFQQFLDKILEMILGAVSHANDKQEHITIDRKALEKIKPKKKKDYTEYWNRYGEYFANENIWMEYSNAYQTVFSVQPNFVEGLFEYARSARNASRLEVADEYYDRAISAGARFLEREQAYYIGRFHQDENKNPNKANKYYRLYLELDPYYLDVSKASYAADYVNWQYSKHGAFKQAFPYSKLAYDLKPDDKRIVANYCTAFVNLYRYADGIPYCMESLAIDDDYSWPHFMLAQIYQNLGDSEKYNYHYGRYQSLSK